MSSVELTKHQIQASPDLREDEPVTDEMQARLYDHYGWDPYRAEHVFRARRNRPDFEADPRRNQRASGGRHGSPFGEGDPHLRSVVEANGYHVHATDGDIGHVENFLASDVNWDIRYLVIATHNWWPGKHVQLAPYAVKDIDWAERRINVNVTRDQVKSSPPWDPLAMADQSPRNNCIAITAGPATAGRRTRRASPASPC